MSKNLALILFVAFAFASRFLSWPPNFSPLLAVGLFCGFTFSISGMGLILPLALMIGSDLVLGVHETMMTNYLAIAAISVIGWAFKKSSRLQMQVVAPVSASLIFFLVSNAGVWWVSGMYSHDWAGLVLCYEMGLPFFSNTLLSTLIFNALFINVWKFIEMKVVFASAPDAEEI